MHEYAVEYFNLAKKFFYKNNSTLWAIKELQM